MKRFLPLLLFACGLALFAQDNPNLEKGLKPFGTFRGGDLDSVSMTNGNLTLHIPLWSYSQRGALRLNYVVGYNNNSWKLGEPKTCGGVDGCWRFWTHTGAGVSVAIDQGIPVSGRVVQVAPLTSVTIYTAGSPDGAAHQLAPYGSPPVQMAIDASGIRGIDRDGVQGLPTGANNTMEDANGNKITKEVVNSVPIFRDTLGRVIPLVPTNLGSGDTTDYSGCTGSRPIIKAKFWSIPAYNNQTATLKFCIANVHLHHDGYADDNIGAFTIDVPWLQSIVLPNGQAWTFEYSNDDNGNLTSVTLPTGGVISYVWGTAGACIGGDTVSNVRVISRSTNDGSGPRTTNYLWGTESYGGSPPVRTVIHKATDALHNDTEYTITGLGGSCSLYETERRQYRGTDVSRTLLKTVRTAYSWTTNPMAPYAPSTVANVLPTTITTIWPSGNQTVTQKTYDSGYFTIRDPNPNKPTTYPGSYGAVLTETVSDWSARGGGTLQKRINTYKFQTDLNYRTNNLLDLPATQEVQNSSSQRVAYTTYAYDQTSTTASGATQLNTTPWHGTIYRGNVTTVSRWLNTTGAFLATTTSYFDNGNVRTTADPGGHVTTFAYDVPSTQAAYLTRTDTPNTGTTTHFTSTAYDLNSGLPTSTTDENGQTTTLTYDMVMRPSQVTDPAGGQVNFAYSDVSPYKVTVTSKVTGTLNRVDEGEVDAFGRVKQVRLMSDPDGVVYGDTTYDVLGRVATVSNPYRLVSDPTYGLTTSAYDDLGRVTTLTAPDASVSSTSYADNCVTVTDPAGKARKSWTDGLGRLVQVFEDPATLNYETDYQYDALGNLTRVDQKGGSALSANWRTRTFTYDSLSRLLTAVNPESGTIIYSYDTDSNVTTKDSPQPNQASASLHQYIDYC